MADFGLAFFAGATPGSFGPNPGGAARWLAPELLETDENKLLPTPSSDVFSFARVCIEVTLIITKLENTHNTFLSSDLYPKCAFRAHETRCSSNSIYSQRWNPGTAHI